VNNNEIELSRPKRVVRTGRLSDLGSVGARKPRYGSDARVPLIY
jgi:hypothetical protein